MKFWVERKGAWEWEFAVLESHLFRFSGYPRCFTLYIHLFHIFVGSKRFPQESGSTWGASTWLGFTSITNPRLTPFHVPEIMQVYFKFCRALDYLINHSINQIKCQYRWISIEDEDEDALIYSINGAKKPYDYV